jgi:hypothetical protein
VHGSVQVLGFAAVALVLCGTTAAAVSCDAVTLLLTHMHAPLMPHCQMRHCCDAESPQSDPTKSKTIELLVSDLTTQPPLYGLPPQKQDFNIPMKDDRDDILVP